MPTRLFSADPHFVRAFDKLVAARRQAAPDVAADVATILAGVRQGGDAALIELSQKFDGVDLRALGLRVAPQEIVAAVASCPSRTLAALTLARDRITSHHERQRPADDHYVDADGVELGHRWTPVQSAGLYVPGGTASYPSSVLMNAVPARIAGVGRVVMTVPAPGGALNPLVLVAAHLAGVSEIYRLGGAQAIAALAFGTETIGAVDKIVGPGNAYVAEAKRQVFGTVGIDSIAGPSEVLVIADRDNNPEWIAADLLAQAEHDTAAQAILITDDEAFAGAVESAVGRQLASLPRGNVAAASWNVFGAVIVIGSMDEAPALADRIAAEHVEIATRDADALAARIANAGALFLGALTPEVIGDYVAGSNHVLPTSRSARFSSGLGVQDFMKRTSLLRLDREALAKLAAPAMILAEAEGLAAHERSVAIRLKGDA